MYMVLLLKKKVNFCARKNYAPKMYTALRKLKEHAFTKISSVIEEKHGFLFMVVFLKDFFA